MAIEEIREKVIHAELELTKSGLEPFGYKVFIELSVASYRELVRSPNYIFIRVESDSPTEAIYRGEIFGTPFIITQGSDRVLIAKEVEE